MAKKPIIAQKKQPVSREALEERLLQLQQQRATYIKQAEQQLATFNGAILMLEELINGQGEAQDDEAAA